MAYEAIASDQRSRQSDASADEDAPPTDYGTAEGSPISSASLDGRVGTPGGASDQDEGSSLLSPVSTSPRHSRAGSQEFLRSLDYQENEDGHTASKSVFYLFILTLSAGGLQISWATENSKGTPYLQSLGMSKSLLALVWIAGPLTGVLVQPYIGIMSDNSRSRWGKRIPFMIAGAIATSVSFILLAWTKEIVRTILGIFGADPESHAVQTCTIIFAIFCIYALDFSINMVQAGIRAFIVDNAPYHQQEDANAWAGRTTGVGNILGFLSGYVNLPKHLPWLGGTQMQVLCALSAFAICATVLISALYIRERDPSHDELPASKTPGLVSFFTQTFRSALRMPTQIRKVCIAQFFNWLGWFGFLFYMTSYVGQVKLNPYFASHKDLSPEQIDEAWEDATRYATFALLLFAITSFSASTIIPFFVVRSYAESPLGGKADRYSNRVTDPRQSRFRARLDHYLSLLKIPWLTLRRAWLLSHLMFTLCMLSTFFVFNYAGATILTAFIGIPWAMSLWAPFALISAEVSKRDYDKAQAKAYEPQADGLGEADDQAGVIMGLHNVAISAPQILATVVASIIFKFAQKSRGEPDDNSVGWVLRFGALTSLAAAYFTYRIGEEGVEEGSSRQRRGYGIVGEQHGAEVGTT